MYKPTDKTIKQYEGCLNTPNLWLGFGPYQLEQFSLKYKFLVPFRLGKLELKNLRLGKLVEQFLCYQISNSDDEIQIIDANMQIQKGKQTIGEIDVLLKDTDEISHVEIVYKFYLYVERVGNNSFQNWVGPNQKDSLYKKLEKLKFRQFPLLYKEEVAPWLTKHGLTVNEIQQKVLFKGQLFLPFEQNVVLEPWVNEDCIYGFYLSFKNIELLHLCKFFIPEKLDWLCEVQMQVDWLSFESARSELLELMHQQKSPLCWIKYNSGEVKKCFIVWW